MRIQTRRPIPAGMQFFFSRIFPLLFVLAGIAVLLWGFKELHLAQESSRWPTAQGVVTLSTVDSRRDSKGHRSYHAAITYNFTVNDVVFSSNRISFSGYSSSNPAHARNVANQYPVGKTVTVYYQPNNPNEAVLESGVTVMTWFLPVFGLIFLGAGLLMMRYLPKALQNQTNTTRFNI